MVTKSVCSTFLAMGLFIGFSLTGSSYSLLSSRSSELEEHAGRMSASHPPGLFKVPEVSSVRTTTSAEQQSVNLGHRQ